LNTQAQKLQEITKEKKLNNDFTTKVLAITSGKGGVGKSIIASNIAYALASRGYKVAIFDASIGLANLDIIFNVKIEKNLLNLLKNECTLKDITIEVEKNLSLIPGESGSEILNFTNHDIYSQLITASEFLNEFDYLIIDTGSGIGENVQTFLQHADEVIVITQPDPSAITDAYALIKISANINENINLIVNNTENENEGRFIYERIKKVAENNLDSKLFLNFLGAIDSSHVISKTTKLRHIFVKCYKNSVASFQLNEIIDNLIFQLEHQAPIKKKRNMFTLFFKRLIENF
jgi:flagellar biosynthesis protein FlhG